MAVLRNYLPSFFAHIVIWTSIAILMFYPLLSQTRPIPRVLFASFGFGIALFYLNYFYLVPKFLLEKNILIYSIISFFLIVVGALLINWTFPFPIPENIQRFPRFGAQGPQMISPGFFMRVIVVGIPYIISMILRMYTEWKKNEDLRKIVEKEKVQSELQFLKTQLNPHFLFNSLNAIYALSVKNSPDTSLAIVNLSELMRYMLYEADKDLVPLEKEIEYIKSYVDLQRLRLSDSKDVGLHISGEEKGKSIPPLLFISFIENAFKHGTDYNGKTHVKIDLCINKESVHLKVTNKIGVFKEPSKNSGVGLENVRNRLKLLYPNTHELDVKNDGSTYLVDLTLKR